MNERVRRILARARAVAHAAKPVPMALLIGVVLFAATSQVARVDARFARIEAATGENPFASRRPAAGAGLIIPAEPARDPVISLEAPESFRSSTTLAAALSPADPGKHIAFQVRSGQAWTPIAHAVMDDRGVAAIRWAAPRPGMYTIRAVAGGGSATVVSGAVNVAALARGARVVRWREWVEDGLETGRAEFVRTLGRVYRDARGWAATGEVFFVYTPEGPVDLTTKLATPKTTDRLCRPADTRGIWSCRAAGSIVINSDRWSLGTKVFNRPLDDYRTLAINHETGHALGFGHSGCGGRGRLAPVMMQQSKGLDGCLANPWPLASELARL